MNDLERSRKIFAAAQQVLPGGVNSPVRAFKSVGGEPPIMAYGQGPRLFDVDGNSYIDYMLSWGPLILGHAHPVIVETLQRAAQRGTSYGASTELELVMAQLVVDAVPSIEKVRFVNSGTEATMSALRLARGVTGRDFILKFEGGYHGHADGLLAKAGSGVATLSLPDSPGVPPDFAKKTLLAPYNDLDAVRAVFDAHKDEIAAVIIEPVAANMGVVPPVEGFLPDLREIATQEGALLIFDEVVTGFRVGPGGAQELFGVEPDLTCLGKVIGGGLPVGAYGGRADIMSQVAPEGAIYQAGTLSGNPLAMAAGIATLRLLREDGAYRALESLTEKLTEGLAERAKRAEIDLQINRVGSMFTLFFTDGPVRDYEGAKRSDTERFARFFRAMLKRGVYLPPSQFESWFTSFAHMDAEIDETLAAAEEAFQEVQS